MERIFCEGETARKQVAGASTRNEGTIN